MKNIINSPFIKFRNKRFSGGEFEIVDRIKITLKSKPLKTSANLKNKEVYYGRTTILSCFMFMYFHYIILKYCSIANTCDGACFHECGRDSEGSNKWA